MKEVYKILLIHGPNLNLLGKREVEHYGNIDTEKIIQSLKEQFANIELHYYQSNLEGEIINTIQQANNYDGILINAGAYSHTSIGISDALKTLKIPKINIHISNIYRRENYRHTDIVGNSCNGSIVGLGTDGYSLAMECLMDLL